MAKVHLGQPWDTVELYDSIHHSGEFGERVYRVRRVRTADRDNIILISGLFRIEWFNPDDSGTSYDWESFDWIEKE